MLWPIVYGAAVVNVLTIDTSADAAAVPPLPMLSVLLVTFGSGSLAETFAVLSNEPAALIVAVTVMVTFDPTPRVAIVHGSALQPPPVTFVMARFVGVSLTCTLVAIDGPAFATTSVYVTL